MNRLPFPVLLLTVLISLAPASGLLGQSSLTGPTPTNNIGASMYAFELAAIKHIEVTDFSVRFTPFSFPSMNFLVYVKKGPGSYAGALNDPHSWELIGSPSLAYASGQVPLNLGLSLLIPAGETRSFLIASESGFPFSIVATNPTGSVAAANTDLSLLAGEGSGFAGFYLLGGAPNTSFTGSVHYNIVPQVADDLALEAFLSPAPSPFDCSPFSNAEFVTVRARNMGTNTVPALSILQFDLDADGQAIVSDSVFNPSPIAPGATFTHSFSISVDLSAGFSHTLTASVSLAGDLDAANDSLGITVQAGGSARVSTLPFVEDFSYLASAITPGGTLFTPGVVKTIEPPPGWQQDPNDSTGLHSQWHFGKTFSGEVFTTTYPSSASIMPPSGSPYPVRLITPCIDLTQATHPRLSFGFYNQVLSSNPTPPPLLPLSVDVIRESTGMIDVDVEGPLLESLALDVVTGIMRRRVVDLTAYAGDVVRIVFRADLGPLFPSSHPSIDNVRVEEGLPTPGQNWQPGFAAFQLDNEFLAKNVMGDELYIESGGPYFVTKSSGDTVSFGFRGQPNQPILLLSGPLNPVAATFPMIGQMDIGGSPDPMTGIPVGIQVVADGTQPQGLGSLFILNGTGLQDLWFTVPPLPIGPHAVYQCAMLTGGANGSWVALSNAIELDIQ